MSPARVLYLVTEDWAFCSHRLPLARAAREAGYAVSVATRVREHGEKIRAAGLDLIPLSLSRRSLNPFRELGSLAEITRVYGSVRPDIVHHVALKPVVYGSIAARRAGVPVVVNALIGLGYVFSSPDAKARIARPVVEAVLRRALGGPRSRLILQNTDDLQLLAGRGLVEEGRVRIIRGSGVDPVLFKPSPEPQGTPLVVFPARMLRDKGTIEFVGAARMLKTRGIHARFALVGDADPENPASVGAAELQAWVTEGVVEWWGWRNDMADVFRQSNLVCLPSYREGLPKALIEAAACARAIVTCDVPGCREVVRHGENGLLVPPRDTAALADALALLLADPGLRQRMGECGRQRAVAEFSIARVAEETLSLYRECLAEAGRA